MTPQQLQALSEDHRHEQFFFDGPTVARLVALAGRYRNPLLACMPSLAVHLAAAGQRCTLLDRDRRFRTVAGFERFDLLSPHMVFGDHDVLFVDPPFANITLQQLGSAVDLLAAGQSTRPHIYVCHLLDRQDELCARFAADGMVRLGGHLGYRSVKDSTQARIHLFGPRSGPGLR